MRRAGSGSGSFGPRNFCWCCWRGHCSCQLELYLKKKKKKEEHFEVYWVQPCLRLKLSLGASVSFVFLVLPKSVSCYYVVYISSPCHLS